MTPYQRLLMRPEWYAKRKEILRRDGYRCTSLNALGQRCDHVGQLNVHHVQYIRGRMPWEYPDALLQTLCRQCHIRETRKNRLRRRLRYYRLPRGRRRR